MVNIPDIVNMHFTKLFVFTNNKCETPMALGIYNTNNYYNGLKARIRLQWVENTITQYILCGLKIRRACRLRNVGVIWLRLLIKHLYLIGAWFIDGQRTNTIKYILKRDWTASSKITRKTYIFSQGTNKRALPMIITKSEKVKFFNPILFDACTIDSLIQHKFCCVILIDRSWRTWKMTQITPTYLTHCYHSSR